MLEINKDNYKGYTELYKNKISFTKNSIKELQKKWVLTIIAFVLFIAGIVFLESSLMNFIATIFGGLLTFGALIKIELNIIKRQCEKVKDRFPYIDINITTEELEKALEQVKILSNGNMNVKNYESYLEYQESIKENKYPNLRYNYDVPNEEIQKAKIKVKKLVKTNK